VKQKVGLPVRLLTLREVAEYLQVHPATVYRLVKTRQLMAVRVGRDFRFDARVVEEWVASGGSTTPSRRGRKKTGRRSAHDRLRK
jgi:excisionase family DNA binding protein